MFEGLHPRPGKSVREGGRRGGRGKERRTGSELRNDPGRANEEEKPAAEERTLSWYRTGKLAQKTARYQEKEKKSQKTKKSTKKWAAIGKRGTESDCDGNVLSHRIKDGPRGRGAWKGKGRKKALAVRRNWYSGRFISLRKETENN